MSETSTATRTVIVEREIAHPPEKVWRALTQPHLISQWLMKNDFSAVVGHQFKLRGEWGGVLDREVLVVRPVAPRRAGPCFLRSWSRFWPEQIEGCQAPLAATTRGVAFASEPVYLPG